MVEILQVNNATRCCYEGLLKFILVGQPIRKYRGILQCHLSWLKIGQKSHIVITLKCEVAFSNIRKCGVAFSEMPLNIDP